MADILKLCYKCGEWAVHSAMFPIIAFKQPGRVLLVGWCDVF